MRISFPAGFIVHLSVNITGCPKTSGLYLFLDYVSTVTARSFMKQKIGPQRLNILRKIAWTFIHAQGRLWYTSVSREFLKPCNFFSFQCKSTPFEFRGKRTWALLKFCESSDFVIRTDYCFELLAETAVERNVVTGWLGTPCYISEHPLCIHRKNSWNVDIHITIILLRCFSIIFFFLLFIIWFLIMCLTLSKNK